MRRIIEYTCYGWRLTVINEACGLVGYYYGPTRQACEQVPSENVDFWPDTYSKEPGEKG